MQLDTRTHAVTPRTCSQFIRFPTGPAIHYVEQGDSRGAPIVFLHGYTDSSFSFGRLWPFLDPNRYRCLALDQRGHGESERPMSGYTPDDFAADVIAFLDVVDIGCATIVGHSMGSLIARRVALTYPDRVSRLVLIGAILGDNEAVGELRDGVGELDDPVPERFAREFQMSTIHAPVPEPFLDRVVNESLKLPARVWKTVLAELFATSDIDHLGRIAAPTLIVWGERDAFFSREEQDRLAAAIPGARLMVYPETGHAPQWERPERVANDLVAFMREAGSGSGPLRLAEGSQR
jgi:non-heme chloroperoxidase